MHPHKKCFVYLPAHLSRPRRRDQHRAGGDQVVDDVAFDLSDHRHVPLLVAFPFSEVDYIPVR